jgi:hypothetical protein
MKWSAITLAVFLASGSALSAQSTPPAAPRQGDPLVLRGCVAAGAALGTYVMSNVYEVGSDGVEKAPARLVNPILYWFKDASNLQPHVGRMVEVSGSIDGLEQSEIELKAGSQKDGSLVVEVEGPGRDVRAAAGTLAGATGTTGTTPQKNDIKATLVRVTMGHVKSIEGACR